MSTASRTEVEKRVAQELKNNQDFIYSTNQWLQNLTVSFDGLKKEVSDQLAALGSKLKSQDILVENLEERTDVAIKKCSSIVDGFGAKFSQFVQNVAEDLRGFECRYAHAGEHQALTAFAHEKAKHADQEIDRLEAHINSQIQRIESQVESKLQNLKKEILNRPSEFPEMKSSLNETLDAYKVDFNGISEKLEKSNKAIFICQKYIEDLYTNLERLKAGKA